MKLYHFLSEKWALEALEKQVIKVSKYDDLNDPFELLVMSLEDKVARSVMQENKRKINEILRILCFSKRWRNPLLWGHYADKHSGIALEFEIPSSNAHPITYEKDRSSLDLHALMDKRDEAAKLEMFKMYTTKYSDWSYEEEYRVQFTKEEFFTKGEHDFVRLNNGLNITGLVLGPLNSTSRDKIERSIPVGKKITVTTTRIAFQSFDVVYQKQKPPYKLVGKG
ncbi:MAG: DUF2971 domain-containing protein [Candidatus Thiodiazotropha sp. (ex Monitilora ramsayi)]|nr:DUF2971 domain-containing protein [Candidatus Thiodiazotropha sp. (ex Monitilora ramsayi)]